MVEQPRGTPEKHRSREGSREQPESSLPDAARLGDTSPDAPTLDSNDYGLDESPPLPETMPSKHPVPSHAGRYPILRELGRGGMGVVYLAADPSLERTVALKRLPARVGNDLAKLEKFKQEARLLASINHPNIATIFSLEEDDEGAFLTMEAIEGETLSQKIARGPLPLQATLHVGRQIARALEAAHRRAVIHRDLKPGNIMFTTDQDVKVLDFGLAASVPEGLSSARANMGAGSGNLAPASPDRPSGLDSGSDGGSAGISGTPGYMSPEQLRNEPPDPAMDVWAFGCVLYECLTGVPAIQGSSLTTIVRNTLHAVIDLTPLPPDTPPSMQQLLTRCVSHLPEDRPRQLTEVRRVLEELLAEAAFQSSRSKRDDAKTTPNNLPQHVSSFIGRVDEIATIRNLLAKSALLTLTGIGGVGKTRLALQVAEDLLQDDRDGVWFVELAPLTDPGDVADAMMRAIGIPQTFERPALESIADYLEARRATIVLDNCEHVIDGVAAVIRTILSAAPQIQIVATSRERLAIEGETSFPVPRFELPDNLVSHEADTITAHPAVQLFLQRARQVRPSFDLDAKNAATVVEICRRLDGIPLAIELAASRVKVLSIEDIHRRLDDRFRLLTGGSRDSLPHHRTLRALIDWSYDQLEPEDKILLSRLSIFANGWTLEAAEEVAAGGAVEDFEVLDRSSSLVDRSLVEVDTDTSGGTTRFRMLETVKAYATARLEESGEVVDLARRHMEYYANLISTAEPEFIGERQAYWFSRFASEHEDIRRAFETCAAPDSDPMIGLRMAGSLFRYWITRGHWNEAYETSLEVLSRTEALPPNQDSIRIYNTLAVVALYHGRMDEARARWERAIEISTAIGHEHGLATAGLNLGNVEFTLGDYDTARRHFSDALQRFRDLDLADGIGRGLISLGNIALCVGDYEESCRCGLEASELMRKEGHAELLAHALIVTGTGKLRLKDLEGARTDLEESLEIQEEVGDQRNTGIATVNLAVILHQLEDLSGAQQHFIRSLHIFRGLGDIVMLASVLEGLATLALDLNQPETAAKAFGGAETIRTTHGTPRMPDEETAIQAAIKTACNILGEEQARGLLAEGAEMELGELLTWVLKKMEPTGTN